MVAKSPFHVVWFSACTALLFILAPGSAHADVTSYAFQITARYGTSCSIGSAAPINFGTLSFSSTPSGGTYSSATKVLVSCTANTPYGVWITLSSNADVSQRRMVNAAGNFINYDLYSDNFTTLVPTARSTSGYLGSGAQDSVPINARVKSGQTLNAGNYSDTIILNLSW